MSALTLFNRPFFKKMKLETGHSNPDPTPPAAASLRGGFIPLRAQFKGLVVFTVILMAAFGLPLFNLVTFALHAELYSHILLIPFVSAYLIWIKRADLLVEPKPNRPMAVLLWAAGAIVLICYWLAIRRGWSPERPDNLAITTFSFLLFLLGGGFNFLGSKYLKAVAFPGAFLFFSVPFPLAMRRALETFFQHGSADVAYLMLKATGMPVFRTGTHFQLPGMAIEVARECSGIHSSIVLIITSLVAAYLFLKSPSNRLLFFLAVIPLALLRNGFRIFVISELCVHIGPQMIDSAIHRQGGPVFFLLSLVPLFLLLVYLIKRESLKEQAMAIHPKK